MKKVFLTICLIGLMYSAKAQTAQTRNVSTCVSTNFLGIVTVWSGSMNTETFNGATNQWEVTSSRPCGQNGGSWDWFWE